MASALSRYASICSPPQVLIPWINGTPSFPVVRYAIYTIYKDESAYNIEAGRFQSRE